MRKIAAGYVLAPIGATVGTACGIAAGALIGALLGTAHLENQRDDLGLMDMILALVVAFLILQIAIPLLAAVGCGLGCYVALRVGGQSAALRTAGFTVAFAVTSVFISADSTILLGVWIAGSAVLARRIAVGAADRDAAGLPAATAHAGRDDLGPGTREGH